MPVVGYEGRYEVSDLGNVRSVDRVVEYTTGHDRVVPGRLLKPYATGKNAGDLHQKVSLPLGRRRFKQVFVHKLVLEAFVGLAPDGMCACHFDDDPTNNKLSNLRWDTQAANAADRIRNNGGCNYNSKTHCKWGHEFTPENTYMSHTEGRSPSKVCRTCRRERQRRHDAAKRKAAA